MSRNALETLLGAVVMAAAIGFLLYAYDRTSLQHKDGYELSARFSSVGSLAVGSSVRLSGIPIGVVTSQILDPESYDAVVTFSVDDNVLLPIDSYASINSDGLLGDSYLRLDPGADDVMLQAGDTFENTEAATNLFRLLLRLFSGGRGGDGE